MRAATTSSTRRCGSCGGARSDLRGHGSGQVALALPQRLQLCGWPGCRLESSVSVRPMRVAARSSPNSTCSDAMRGGLEGGLGGDERVAVAVAADPGAEAHERGGAAGATPGGVGLQRVVEQAVDPRHDLEQRLVEDAHRRAHLVERRRPGRAERRGAPERVDLLEQPAVDPRRPPSCRGRTTSRSVEQLADAADRRRRRPGGAPRSGARSARGGSAGPADGAAASSAPTSSTRRARAPGRVSLAASVFDVSRDRSTRTRWCSSARLTRWK